MNPNVIVVAGGYSVKDYDLLSLPKQALIIGVNDAAYQIPVDHAITMDRLWFEYRYDDIILRPRIRKLWIRSGINKIAKQLHEKVVQFDCDPEAPCILSAKGNTFHGSNSGTVAINLAYQLSTHRIYLLGFDMQKGPRGEPYWYPPYPWSAKGSTKPGHYERWVQEFEAIARQAERAGIEIYNVNHRSQITAFPIIAFDDLPRHMGIT